MFRGYSLAIIAQYTLLALVAILALTGLDLFSWQWWLVGGLLLALAGLYYAWPGRRFHLYLAGELALVMGLTFLTPMAALLGFSFSAHAMILFPNPAGFLWVTACMLGIGGAWIYYEGWLDGLLFAVLFGAGFLGFGSANSARVRAESAHRQSQALLEELQQAHQQLQDYAGQVEELTLARERNRVAREIHDTLAQGFTSIVMHLEAAEGALPDGIPQEQARGMVGMGTVRKHLDQARRTARESLAQARRLVWALRPEILEGSSLPAAMERVVDRWAEDSETSATVSVTGTVTPLPPEVEVTLLRAVQEGLTNARKHARASRVSVTLSYMHDLVALDVQDDGDGFDPGGIPGFAPMADGTGLGLTAMRERVDQLGGSLDVESALGEGTTLVIEIPLQAGQPAAQGISESGAGQEY
jgi:signal transduction histidine kinase